ncbi:MAG: class I SAM-dependent rRNA methyltransferase [Chitinophagales bacterium]
MIRVYLGRGKGLRVEQGHPWIFFNEVEKITGDPTPGDVAEIYNFKNKFIGRGYINLNSRINCRILTRNPDEQIDYQFFKNALLKCKSYREKLGYTENYRLVFGEADNLPGLVIDKFKDVYVMQSLAFGIDKWKDTIAKILMEDLGAVGVIERNDVPIRKLEGLEEVVGFLSPPCETKFTIQENGVQFHVNLLDSQKTGFFLDQKENRLALQHIVKDAEVLDCFTYTGSFALFAAHFGAKHVHALDVSEDAITLAKKNAALNNFENISFETINVFDALPVWVKEGKQYDVVILDPPAFTKNRKGLDSAIKGYKEINLRGMKLVKPGGFLLTFSCSHFMKPELFYEVLYDAANDANKTIRQVQYLTQSKDHPIIWGVEETNYLKGYVVQVL